MHSTRSGNAPGGGRQPCASHADMRDWTQDKEEAESVYGERMPAKGSRELAFTSFLCAAVSSSKGRKCMSIVSGRLEAVLVVIWRRKKSAASRVMEMLLEMESRFASVMMESRVLHVAQ